MPTLRTKVWSGAMDGEISVPSEAYNGSAATMRSSNNYTACVQFSPKLVPTRHVVSSATLRLLISGAVSSGGSHILTMKQEPNAPSQTTYSTATIGTATIPIASDYGDGDEIQYDVTALVQSWLADYSSIPLTLVFVLSGPANAVTYKTADSSRAYAPALDIVFSAIDDGAPYSSPYSLLHDALWDMLASSPDVMALVEDGGLLQYNQNVRKPSIDNKLAADYPFVRVAPSAGAPHIFRTTTSTTSVESFTIEAPTGDRRTKVGHDNLKWAIFRALARWREIILPLRWNGSAFVIDLKITSVAEGLDDESQKAGSIPGWTSLWQVDIEVLLRTADL